MVRQRVSNSGARLIRWLRQPRISSAIAIASARALWREEDFETGMAIEWAKPRPVHSPSVATISL